MLYLLFAVLVYNIELQTNPNMVYTLLTEC